MKKILVCASLIALSTSAFAADASNTYLRLDLGAAKPTFKDKVGGANSKVKSKFKPMYNVGVGYKFNDMFRSDLNVQYQSNKATKGNTAIKNTTFKTLGVMLNGYVDFKNDSMFTPYVTAGVGIARNKANAKTATVTNKSHTALAWNVGLGSKVNVATNVDLDFSYKYAQLGKTAMKVTTVKRDVRTHAHQVTAGVIFNM